jgi:hypothetical protein
MCTCMVAPSDVQTGVMEIVIGRVIYEVPTSLFHTYSIARPCEPSAK